MKNFRYQPINTLKQIDDNIWICDGDIIKMDMVVCKAPFPTRMTIVKMADDNLWIHSPIYLTEEIKQQLLKIGKVKYLVAPNKIHYAYIKQWADFYKDAKVYAVKGVAERAKQQSIDINIDYILNENIPQEWSVYLDYCLFKGSKFMDEAVFRHKPSSTVIFVDLIENFEKSKVPYFYYILLKLVGVTAPNGKAPLDFRLTFNKKGKLVAKQCVNIILNWDIKVVIMAHGKIVKNNAKEFTKNAFKWLKY